MFAVIDALRRADIPYLVAPVEADHELAYLLPTGAVDIVLSGDSDLLVNHGTRLLRVGGTGKLGTTSLCAVPELLHGMPYFVMKLVIATMKRVRRE